MDAAEPSRLKALANDAVIDLFGVDCRELKMAQALEQTVDHIEFLRTQWRPVCFDCDEHLMTYEEMEEGGLIES